MSPDNPAQPHAASPPATSWIVAAIVLVLHWAAPGPLQLQLPPSRIGDAAPTISTDAHTAQPGTLPRAQPRSVTVEAGLPKAPVKRLNAGGKPLALSTQPPALVPANVSLVLRDRRATVPRAAARHFDARGPPLLKA